MANRERKQIFTGARARLLARGQRVGWSTSVSGSREYQKEPIEVLDNIEVEEHATMAYRCSARIGMVGIVTKSLVEAGLLPEVGQDNEAHLKNIIAMEPWVLQIVDNQTEKVLYEMQDCEVSSENFQVGARSVLMIDVTVVGIRIADIAET